MCNHIMLMIAFSFLLCCSDNLYFTEVDIYYSVKSNHSLYVYCYCNLSILLHTMHHANYVKKIAVILFQLPQQSHHTCQHLFHISPINYYEQNTAYLIARTKRPHHTEGGGHIVDNMRPLHLLEMWWNPFI